MISNREKAIEKLISETQNDPDNIALILIGSSATGETKEYSDIDLYLVVSDKKNKEAEKTRDFFFGTWDPTRYYGIEVDGKKIGMDYLREAVNNANDAARYSFIQSRILFTKNNEVEELIKRIPVYPESEYLQRIKLFYGYVKHYRYVGEEAFTGNNKFHAHQCALQLVYFSGRLVLAYNKRLYPCHKRLFSEVEKCDKYPDNERIGYILEDEWAWKTGKLPVSEL